MLAKQKNRMPSAYGFFVARRNAPICGFVGRQLNACSPISLNICASFVQIPK